MNQGWVQGVWWWGCCRRVKRSMNLEVNFRGLEVVTTRVISVGGR